MALLSQESPRLAPNRDRRDAPPRLVLPLVVVINVRLSHAIISLTLLLATYIVLDTVLVLMIPNTTPRHATFA